MRTSPIAVLGAGAMGAGMARALLAAGFAVTVWNRTAERAAPLAREGAALAASPAEALADAEAAVFSLADEAAVERVVAEGLGGRPGRGLTVVDTSTVSPSFARAVTARLAALGARRVEACVIGNPAMAAAGELRVLAAGERAGADAVSDVLDALGRDVRFVGGPGDAAVLKLALNLLLGVQTAGLAEAVAFVEAMGMDRERLLDAFEDSGWRSPVLAFRAGFMRRRAYRPAAFRASLMHKDLALAGREAGERGVGLPVTGRAADRFAAVVDGGRGDDDAAAVVELPRPASGG
ncbi:NAD(P)-dependent oxidoreductase [Streptomyces caatingaensis]|uniref:3-hydroxyisobutyrate dehydrogenase n=1 Tax=Streptomyces caatingaensis TaxID=1678637 RepID=A0A0K9X9Z8_9ACTN|nr:NAD(P)-dependent oxidoreductase [Streptomyces caatingaensis]KNB49926.1 3-hydroxyisobutyrate dehydrogenase [Streptomyces caatingaensis]